MPVSELVAETLQSLENGNVKVAFQRYDSMSDAEQEEFECAALELLRSSPARTTRNAAALLLSDLEVEEVPAIVAELLQDSRTEGARGTLVGALSNYPVDPYLSLLARLVFSAEESYEARIRALDLLLRR